jgi:undecaprenyl-diphosphatase
MAGAICEGPTMTIVQHLKDLDASLFVWLNGFHHPIADTFFYAATHTVAWIPMYVWILYLLWRTYGIQSIWHLVAIALAVTLSDQFTSSFMKPFFERLRPCWEPTLQGFIHIPHGCGGKFGFASSHAADTLSATILAYVALRKEYPFTIYFFIWPLVSSYSRLYLAAHYPGDLLVGWLVGMLSAGFVWWLVMYRNPLRRN